MQESSEKLLMLETPPHAHTLKVNNTHILEIISNLKYLYMELYEVLVYGIISWF